MKRKLYEISDDGGYTWRRTWLTDEEVGMACNMFFVIRKIIIKANACYTGGGIYRFTGQLNDKRFVLGNSEWDELYITDEDPDATEESWYNEWCDEHIVETVKDSAYTTLMNELIKWILENRPDGNYQVEEIEKYIYTTTIEFINEDGNLDETEFDTWDKNELAKLWYEFCIENGIIINVNNN